MSREETPDFQADPELESNRALMGDLMGRYREEVLDTLEPSSAYKASMHKMMLNLVTEQVLIEKRRASLLSLALGRWRRICDCWRELAETSLGFRLTSQLALAVGVGLVLSVITLASIDAGSRADEQRRLRDERLVPASMKLDLNIEPLDGTEDLPLEAPILEPETGTDDLFGR